MSTKPICRVILQTILFTYLLILPGIILKAQTVRYEIEEVPYTKELEGFNGTSIRQEEVLHQI